MINANTKDKKGSRKHMLILKRMNTNMMKKVYKKEDIYGKRGWHEAQVVN